MTVRVLAIDNSVLVELEGVVDADDVAINDAALSTLTLYEEDAVTEVGNQVWPIDLEYIPASAGSYRATIPYTVDVVEGAYYRAKWVIDDGAGRHGEGWIDYQAQRRLAAA